MFPARQVRAAAGDSYWAQLGDWMQNKTKNLGGCEQSEIQIHCAFFSPLMEYICPSSYSYLLLQRVTSYFNNFCENKLFHAEIRKGFHHIPGELMIRKEGSASLPLVES